MNEIVRKVVSVADLPEHLRAGLDPSRPVEIVQHVGEVPPERSSVAKLRARLAHLDYERFDNWPDIVAHVRHVRDGDAP